MQLGFAPVEQLTAALDAAAAARHGKRLLNVRYWCWSQEEDYLAIEAPAMDRDPGSAGYAVELVFDGSEPLVLRPWHEPRSGDFVLRVDDTSGYRPVWAPICANSSAVWAGVVGHVLVAHDIRSFSEGPFNLPVTLVLRFTDTSQQRLVMSCGDDLVCATEQGLAAKPFFLSDASAPRWALA